MTAFVSFALTGCESLRLHDEGRLKTAQEAAATAAEFSAQGGAVFGPMEENLDKVKATQATADEIAERLVDVMRERNQIFEQFVAFENEAVRAVNDQLDRQKLISQALGEPSNLSGALSLEETLERVKMRLDWIDSGLQRFNQAQNALAGLAADGEISGKMGTIFSELGDDTKNNAEILDGFVGYAQNAINQVEQDKQVQAAQQLLNATIQQTASTEQG